MTIEIRPGRYFVAFWYVEHRDDANGQNYLATIYRDKPTDPWTLLYRFRYYKDDKTHDSADERSWTQGKIPASEPEASLEAKLDFMVSALLARGMKGPAIKLECHSDDHIVVMEAFSKLPFVHMRLETESN